MGRRTTSTLVRNLGSIASSVDVDPFIDTATMLIDQVVTCAAAKSVTLGDQQLELMERWLSVHFYTVLNPSKSNVQSKGIGGANISYHKGQVTKGLDGTVAGQQALALDTSGCLEQITAEPAGMTWLGSDEADYDVETWD